MRFHLAMLFLAACGRIGFDPGDNVVPDNDAPTGDDSLVLAFEFEDTLTDRVGGRTPVCVTQECPTFAPGHTGKGLKFTGTECLALDDDPAFHAAEFTMALWVNLDAATGDTAFAKSFDDVATTNNSWEVWFPDDNLAQFSTVENGTSSFLPTTQVTVGAWRHYAGTLDASGKRLYVDGIERAAETPGRGTQYDDSKVRIGCDKDAGTEIGQFTGIVDDVRFYKRALSADEIAELAR